MYSILLILAFSLFKNEEGPVKGILPSESGIISITKFDLLLEKKKTNSRMNDINTDLKILEEVLKKYCNPILEKLDKGLNGVDINTILEKVNLKNEVVKQIFQWRNGLSEENDFLLGQYEFTSHGKMMMLSESVKHYEVNIRDGVFEKGLLPLFTNYGGDYLLFDTNKKSKTFGMLLLFSPAILLSDTPIPIYDSFETFVKTVITCFEKEAYKFNELDNSLEVNYEREAEIAATLNEVNSKFWKDNSQ